MGDTVKSAPTGSIPHWSEVYSMGHESLAPQVAYVQTPRAVQQQPRWGGPKVGAQRLTAQAGGEVLSGCTKLDRGAGHSSNRKKEMDEAKRI